MALPRTTGGQLAIMAAAVLGSVGGLVFIANTPHRIPEERACGSHLLAVRAHAYETLQPLVDHIGPANVSDGRVPLANLDQEDQQITSLRAYVNSRAVQNPCYRAEYNFWLDTWKHSLDEARDKLVTPKAKSLA